MSGAGERTSGGPDWIEVRALVGRARDVISRAEAERLAREIEASGMNVVTLLVRPASSMSKRQRRLARRLRALARMATLRWNRSRIVAALKRQAAGRPGPPDDLAELDLPGGRRAMTWAGPLLP